MPENMRYDNNGQPMGYGEPVDPSMYAQDPAWVQYQQQAYQGGMPSPQEIYSQQQYMDPNQAQGYMDPNQMYMDPNQSMYGAQPMQQDAYGQYAPQGGYMDPDMAMGGMPGGYPEMDPTMAAQQPYMEPDAQYMQGMPGYGQQPMPDPMQQGYPQAQPYGQMPQQVPGAQPMPGAPQAMPSGQAMPQQSMQPEPEPVMDKKAAKRAAKEQSRAAKKAQAASQPHMGPEPASGKAVACMVLGILTVIFALIPPVGIILGIVVRKMSGSYMAQGGRSPKAETGRIFATVGLIFSLILLVILIIMGIIIYAGLYGESLARTWSVFYNNSPFGNIVRIPIPNPLGS